MAKIVVKADKRSEMGKGSARSLRRNNVLPAILYGEGNSIPIKLDQKMMRKLIYTGAGEHALITIELSDDESKKSEHPVLVKDYQMDPVTDELLHVDFIQVSLEKNVQVTVPIVLTKEPVGVKLGGILQHIIREVEVECLPTEIPEKIEVDAGSLEIGHSLHVSDLPSLGKVAIITDPSEVILTVSAPVVEEAPAPAEEEAEEPELVKAKGKGEEEEAEKEKEKEKEEKEAK